MSARICFVVLDHRPDEYFGDLVEGIRRYCPDSDLVWYDSAEVSSRDEQPPVHRLACSKPLKYAKVTPFFLDMFEWAAGQRYDYFVNAETDMAFVGPGFEQFVPTAMSDLDYMAPRFVRNIPRSSKWRPYRSLRRELPELLEILGVEAVNGAFSPAQVFSAKYVQKLVASSCYEKLRGFVERNQDPGASFTLQEILLPTIPDAIGLRAGDYPEEHIRYNRYRPYHALSSVLAAKEREIPFVHPVRRDPADRARQHIRGLVL